MDGHRLHLTIEFVSYCYKNKITLFLLLAHSTHLLCYGTKVKSIFN
jgi:hypothetical protein